MKRVLVALLLMLMILPATGYSAKRKRTHSKPKTTPEATFESVHGSDDDADQDADKPKPKPAPRVSTAKKQVGGEDPDQAGGGTVEKPVPIKFGPPMELHMNRAASRKIDLRSLPQVPPAKFERPEVEEPQAHPTTIETFTTAPDLSAAPIGPVRNAIAPAPTMNFDGLDFANWGNGHPPDTNGDVGPTYYIQSINTSLGVFRKSDGVRVAAFSFNTFMSQGNFGNLCDTDNFGDPVILYDTYEDRWIVTDFAFQLDGSSNVVNPPGSFQCFAVSMTGDPVSGGWNYYSINTAGGLGDYPKFGIWPDGLYMSANMFGYASGAAFIGPRVYALNKAQMYAGKPTIQVVTFNAPSADFAVLPTNSRLQSGTPPPGTPNYFVSTWEFTNALTVYKFHVNWSSVGLSTFTGPDVPLASTSWPNASVANAPSLGGNALDVLQIRAMMQNQYTNIGGVESVWTSHTVRRGNTSGFAAPRWYQTDVTGGTVNPNLPQASTWDPDGANVMYRFMPSLAVDRAGDMALGYSTSNSTTKPAVKYAGRLAGDPVNTLTQTEQVLIQGTGTQTGSCGGTCTRWGDYSAMSLDPDGCTFWYTNMYYAVDGLNHLTRIGSFAYPSCTPVGAGGTLQGTVTATLGGAPMSGVTVSLGSRTTTTNGSGFYTFTGLPAGTYPTITASFPGYNTNSVSSIVITDGGTTIQNFSMDQAAASGCVVDTTQADFNGGTQTNVDATTTPGSLVLSHSLVLDQQNTTIGTSGVGITVTSWGGQTFTAGQTGPLKSASLNLFCSSCTGTTPNLTLSLRATSGGLPTGADLATATITGFSNGGVASDFLATFSSPVVVTAGTQYALVIRPVTNPSPGTYALTRSGTSSAGANVYANGARVAGATSGTVWSTPLTGGVSTDAGFATYLDLGYSTSGTYVSATRDTNPATGLTPIWSTLSWTATTPANTSVKFQVAGSNSDLGPFNFVGPDGTAATFFTTSGSSLNQFYGFRYLQYKAYLDTTDTNVTPQLDDVTTCYTVADCSGTISITPTPSTVCPLSTGNTASGPAGGTTYAWSITNGTITGITPSGVITYTAGASGTVDLTLDLVEAGGCHKTGTFSVPIAVGTTPTITPGGPTTFCAGGSVTLTSSSATGNQWNLNGNPIGGATNQTYVATASGDYTVTVAGCTGGTSANTTVTVNPLPPTPTITPGGPTTFCTGGSVTLTSSSATGNQWYLNGNPIGGTTNQTYAATASGNYSVIVTTSGCSSSASANTTVTVNPIPPTPTITPGGPTTFCAGGSVTLTSSNATGNQWYLDGNPIGGATNQTYAATASGNYSVIVTTSGCSSSASANTTVTVNPIPPTPTITPGGPTTFCAGGSVTLTSSSATGNQWYLDGNPIGGATNQTYAATASGNYSVIVTTSGCSSAASANTTVTVNPIPPTPTITPGGPTTFCAGGSVTLTSSSASGNQWYLNGSPIGGATNQTYAVTVAGDYTVAVTTSGCTSSTSATTTVTINPNPNATITTSASAVSGSTGNTASVANAGVGASYNWSITGGTITGGSGTNAITYTAGAAGTLTLNVTVTTGSTCSDSKSANVNVTSAAPAVTVTAVNPTSGTRLGGTPVTITGTGFLSGATVTFGGSNATSVVVVNSTTITAVTPAHAAATVNVTVTNTNSTTGTLTGGYVYNPQQFDPNGDTTTDPADIFYLVHYLFTGGPAPSGAAGMLSGDANGDNVVDPADIFYTVNYLFTGGPQPAAAPRRATSESVRGGITGAVSLGRPQLRNGNYVVPVIVTTETGSPVPQALALKVQFDAAATGAVIHRAGAASGLTPTFEISRQAADGLSYLVSFDERNGGLVLANGAQSLVVAEIEIPATRGNGVELALDPSVTLLTNRDGVTKATVGNGALRLGGNVTLGSKVPGAPKQKNQGETR